MNAPQRPQSLLASLYLYSGASAFWLSAAIATLFAIPQYSRYYGDLNQNADAGAIAALLLTLTAGIAILGAAVAILLVWLNACGRPTARRFTWVYTGLSTVLALILIVSDPFSTIRWHDQLMTTTTLITLLLLTGATVLLTRPASNQFFSDYRTIRQETSRPVTIALGAQPVTPQQPHPQPMYPQAPASSSGIAITAMILCTISSLSLLWSAISFLIGLPPVEGTSMPPGASLLANGVWTIGDLLLITGTILMWSRVPAGRILAAIGLSMVLTSMLTFELVALSAPHDSIVRPWTYAINVFTGLSLAFVLSPGTGRYFKARHSSPYQQLSQQSPHTQQPYGTPGFGPGSPGGPPQKSKLPWIIGTITAVIAVMAIGCAGVLFSLLLGRDDKQADSITYEISGTAPGPLSVSYAGSDGKKVEVTVSTLPWSVTVTPAPKFVSIFAVSPSLGSNADITLTLKRGKDVLKTCHGGGPCLMPFPSGKAGPASAPREASARTRAAGAVLRVAGRLGP